MARSKLEDLIALAGEPSSARRRELLREVSSLFFANEEGGGPGLPVFDGPLAPLQGEMQGEVRAELAKRNAQTLGSDSGRGRMAADEGRLDASALARSPFLTQDDLLHAVSTGESAHLQAVAGRHDLSTPVVEALIARCDDRTLGVLLRNAEARLPRRAAEAALERAIRNPDLQDAFVSRAELADELVNELYPVVEPRLRERIRERNVGLGGAALDRALDGARKRLAARAGALPEDFDAAEAEVRALLARGELTPEALAGFLAAGRRTPFLVALSEAAEIDFHTARRIVERTDLDALAIVCKAAGFDRTLFLTFALLILGPNSGEGRAQAHDALYADLPRDAAVRTLQFWRMRRQMGDLAAA